MSERSFATHRIRIAAPLDQCYRFFTPAGEELWAEGWHPNYVFPSDGRTEQGMVFTTGQGDAYTIWTLVDFDPQAHYSRYARVTPALRSGWVEVKCSAVNEQLTDVQVSYTLTGLNAAGDESLESFEGAAFAAMIDGWQLAIDQLLPSLLAATIR